MVSKSSVEAEYKSMSMTCAEITWMLQLLGELGISSSSPVPLHCDNQAAIYIASNTVFHERTKHLEIDFHFIRDKFKAGVVKPVHVGTKQQIADVLTKILPAKPHHLLLHKLGVSDFLTLPT